MARSLLALLLLLVSGCAGMQARQMAEFPRILIIAHRGASGERPEHTLLAYQRAIDQGADFIEPDLVSTKDGVLIARHENEISETTDIALHPEFAMRRTTKMIDGIPTTGWFTEDFTLAELRTLRAKERLPLLRPANTAFDGQAPIPTLDEIIALAKRASKATGRTIGIYPETKHPSYFASIGLPLEPPLLAALKAAGWDRADAPVFIQSFEPANLKALHTITRVRLIQLMRLLRTPVDPDFVAMCSPAGLREIATYAQGIGPEKAMLIPPSGPPACRVADAHAAGLKVHPWTFRAENAFLPTGLRNGTNPADHGDLQAEILSFLQLDVDGFFTDYPYIGAQARATWGSPAR
jgi:glycerophosphoryl diester phosphodiesterase